MFTAILLLLFCIPPDDGLLDQYRPAAAQWEDEVAALQLRTQERIADTNDILFIGSSSIRLWDVIEEDMAPWQVVRRGFGGARYSDVAIFLERLLQGHRPKAVVYYVGNDISGNKELDKTPEQVAALVDYIVRKTRDAYPDCPIYFIEITTAPSRLAAADKIAEANERIKQVIAVQSNCYFIPTKDFICDDAGNPRAELFVEDRLHLSAAGYDLWAARIKTVLAQRLRP